MLRIYGRSNINISVADLSAVAISRIIPIINMLCILILSRPFILCGHFLFNRLMLKGISFILNSSNLPYRLSIDFIMPNLVSTSITETISSQ